MKKAPPKISIPISQQLTDRIQTAYRFSLALNASARRARDGDYHEQRLATSLAKLATQQYLIQEQIPFSNQTTSAIDFDTTELRIGGRRIRFLLSFTKNTGSNISPTPRFSLRKSQYERLESNDDLIIFTEIIRPPQNKIASSGYFYFLPNTIHRGDRSELPYCFVTLHTKTTISVYGLDSSGQTINIPISPSPMAPCPIPKNIDQISYLYTTDPALSVDISYPGEFFINVRPADWLRFGISAEKLVLHGYLPAIELKRRINKLLFVDTPFRIRYFKDEKLSIDPAETRDLSRLFKFAKIIDRGK